MVYRKNQTGLIYDSIMTKHKCLWNDEHIDVPDRIKNSFERCLTYDLVEKCVQIKGRFCTDEEIEKCHSSELTEFVKTTQDMDLEELKRVSLQNVVVYYHPDINNSARFSLGSSIELMDQIISGRIDNGFAIIRPPGHHASYDEPCGLCIFNNAAVAAKIAIEKHNLERILIVDWDVHHGQGTQDIFYDSSKVLYFSIHQYEYGNHWPNLRRSDFDFIGEKEGKGYNINIPLNKKGMGNAEYLAAFHNLLLPIAYEYQPQLVIVSAGFDSSIGNLDAGVLLTPAIYCHFINALSTLSDGKLCVLLEGGYCLKSLSESVALTVRTLLGYPCPKIQDLKNLDANFVQTLMNSIMVLRPYWKCLQNLNDMDETKSVDKFLDEWNENYRKDIQFYDPNNRKVGRFPTFSEQELERVDKELDELIQSTDLFVPDTRVHTLVLNKKKSELIGGAKPSESDDLETAFLQAISQVIHNKSNNAVIFADSINRVIPKLESLAIFKNEASQYIKKTIEITISDQQIWSLKSQLEESNVLTFKLGNDNHIENMYNLNMTIRDDASLLTTLFKIILPISYQFNPDIVLISIDLDYVNEKTKLSTVSIEHMLRLLSSLAGGKLIAIFQSENDYDSTPDLKNVIQRSISVLNGEKCSLAPKTIADNESKRIIKNNILLLKKHWNSFQFTDKLPSY